MPAATSWDAGDSNDLIAGDDLSFFGNPSAVGGNDVISAGNGNDEGAGRAGGRHRSRRGGDDFVAAVQGDDTVRGGDGDDSIIGGTGRDYVLGGPDSNLMAGGQGSDHVVSGSGADLLIGDIPGQGEKPVPATPDPHPNSDTRVGGTGTDSSFSCEFDSGVETAS